MKAFLITGCGRSGTGFYSRMLRDNGIECGHESFVDFSGCRLHSNKSESSWMAVPLLDSIPDKYYIIRTIREPLLVIKSFVDLEVLSDKHVNSPYRRYIKNNLSSWVQDGEDIEKQILNAANYYIEWNHMFDIKSKKIESTTIRFEDIIKEDFYIIGGEEFKVPKTVINDKKSKKIKNVKIEKIIEILGQEKCQQLKGYYSKFG